MTKEFTYEVTATPRDKAGKSRVYVWDAPDPDIALPAPTIRGEVPEVDKAYGRYNRAVVRIQKAHLVAAMEQGLLPDIQGIRHSVKAGCSCTCSPGFIIDTHTGFDYHLKITVIEEAEALKVKALVTPGAIKG